MFVWPLKKNLHGITAPEDAQCDEDRKREPEFAGGGRGDENLDFLLYANIRVIYCGPGQAEVEYVKKFFLLCILAYSQ